MDGRMLALARPAAGRIILTSLTTVAVTGLYMAQGVTIALAIAAMIDGNAGDRAILLLATCALMALLRASLLWAANISAQMSGQDIRKHLRARLLDRLILLGPAYSAGRQTGDLQAVIVDGVEALEGRFSRFLPALVAGFVGVIAALIAIALIDWPTALLLALFLIAQPLFDHLWMGWHMPKISGIFGAMGSFGAYLLDSLQGLVTLKAFDASGRRRQELSRRAGALRRESMPTLSVTMMRVGMSGLFSFGGVATVLAVNSWRVAHGTLSPVPLLLTLFLARELFRPLEQLEREFHALHAASGAVQPIFDLLNAQADVRETAHPAMRPGRTDIVFEDVTFGYAPQASPTLSDLSFSVPQGALVAVVGPSGGGKSTLLSLLLRFYNPQVGVIRIGGVNIAELALSDLRSMIMMVSQDVQLFHGSIADNLRLGRTDASDADIRAAARAAHIDDFIDQLPRGYDSEVGERGAQLSGGQRQRIAIARALVKNAPILLLDEATSSVDPASERAIQTSLEALAGKHTTLVIAHRLSTIERADMILVLDGGRIVERGTHAVLLQAGGTYARLIAAQEMAA